MKSFPIEFQWRETSFWKREIFIPEKSIKTKCQVSSFSFSSTFSLLLHPTVIFFLQLYSTYFFSLSSLYFNSLSQFSLSLALVVTKIYPMKYAINFYELYAMTLLPYECISLCQIWNCLSKDSIECHRVQNMLQHFRCEILQSV